MNRLNTEKLIDNINAKGIECLRNDKKLFKNYDYFQVLNGYKGLFITGIETIDDIVSNIDDDELNGLDNYKSKYKKNFQISNYANGEDLKLKIVDKIGQKYGLHFENNSALNVKIDAIKKIEYVHHIYKAGTKYKDFVRMYEFEHELRCTLLKYTLIIEENIKRIFISVLNDYSDNSNHPITVDYLANISNYNMSEKNTYAVQSLKKVIELYGSDQSKPILRKRRQKIKIPYWIIINEMTLGQTLKTIENIEEKIKKLVIQKCLNEFTNLNLNILDNTGKSSSQIDLEKKQLKDFSRILQFVGEFRNLLAHNQPIYNYNIADCDYMRFPNNSFEQPKPPKNVNANNHSAVINYQRRQNAEYMRRLNEFYGTDSFNSRTHNINIDLSWIIYVEKKIVNKLGYNDYEYEILNVYKKYNIIHIPFDERIDSITELRELKKYVENINFDSYTSENMKSLIENGKTYKRELNKEYGDMKDALSNIKKKLSKIDIKLVQSKYSSFVNQTEYTAYTNIDSNYLLNVLI